MLNKPGSVRITPEDFLNQFPDAKPLFDFFTDKIYVEKSEMSSNNMDDAAVFYDLTIEAVSNRRYGIQIRPTKNGNVYFGAYFTCRDEKPFETWQRGHDMVDGKLCKSVIDTFIQEVVDDLFVEVPSMDEKHQWEGAQEDDESLDSDMYLGGVY